jgi:ADP-heptose:LPS heptosyltransferase
MPTLLYKIKKSHPIRILFTGFKQFLSIFMLPRVAIKMWRIILFDPKKKKIVIALVEHIGDIVASEPVDRFLKERDPDQIIFRVVKSRYKELIRYNPHIDQIIEVSCLSEWIYLRFFLRLFSKIDIVDLHIDQRVCFRHYIKLSNPNVKGIHVDNYFNFGNLLETFSLTAGLPKLNERPVYYLPEKTLPLTVPEKYIVVHTLSNGDSKMWPAEKWNELANHLISKGFNLIEIGLQARIKNTSPNFVDLCGKLSFTEIAFLIRGCSLFIGIDSSFAHFANALRVKNILIMLGKLHDFGSYVPYSGLSVEQIDDIVIRENGPLRNLEVDTVIDRLMRKLEKA